jgi:hypothetical protein
LITVKKPSAGNIIVRKLSDYKIGLFATKSYLERHSAIHGGEDLKGHRLIGYIDDLLYDPDLNWMNELAPGMRTQFRSSTIQGQKNSTLADKITGLDSSLTSWHTMSRRLCLSCRTFVSKEHSGSRSIRIHDRLPVLERQSTLSLKPWHPAAFCS